MNSKIRFEIILSGVILGALLFFSTIQLVHAEDITPTPDGASTETITPMPTDPVPTEPATSVPTDLAPTETPTPAPTAPVPTETTTPAPIETIIPTEEPMMKGLMGAPSPMFASSSDSVWFMYNGNRQNFFTISEAIDKLITE
jgi:hypothetical protein